MARKGQARGETRSISRGGIAPIAHQGDVLESADHVNAQDGDCWWLRQPIFKM
jgi:hypothetical protein